MRTIFINIGYMLSSLCTVLVCSGQNSNADYTKGSININLPKSPESASFERYGNIPVDEYSGTTSITVPLYTVKSNYLELPLSLNYHASGIKVNQEATWVGLGFDLICGGRITVETRGNVDFVNYSQGYRDGVKRLFNKWSKPYGPYQNVSNNAIKMGYAFLDYGEILGSSDPIMHRGDTLWDHTSVITTSAWEGDGQPDIYHASFLGKSINFFNDLETGGIRAIGENSTYAVYIDRAYNFAINGFIITDNNGVQYHFYKKEDTYFRLPFAGSLFFATTATSAYLLTKIKKNDDEILLTYSNYGYVKPAVTWSQSISGHMPDPVNDPGDTRQNETSITTNYLTKIESNSTIVDFTLSSRIDLDGDGARKLDKITIKAKENNEQVKEYTFDYDYFIASAQAGDANLPAIKSKRLRLLSVKENASGSSPWKFYYDNTPGPNKYSFSQDHWGYFNNMPNSDLIPGWSSSFADPALTLHYEPLSYCQYTPHMDQCYGQKIGYSIPSSFRGYAYRECAPNKILAYTLDSIVYPTGGATKLILEPHISYFPAKQINNFTGGGIRVAAIKNYTSGNVPTNLTTYDYQNSGIYLGDIQYLKVSTKWPVGNSLTLSAWGVQNNDGQAVGYASVKKTQVDFQSQINNGYEVKYYKVNNPLNPEHVYAPEPYCYYSSSSVCYWGSPNPIFYYINRSGNGPMPKRDLDGKLYKHEIFTSANSLVKRSEYYYRQAGVQNRFFSIKAEDNYYGRQYSLAFDQMPGVCVGGCWDLGEGPSTFPMAWRRWVVSLEPATSFYTLLDSVVENSVTDNGNLITTKQAFKYNSFYQQEFVTSYTSDGSQNISYIKTPASFLPYPPVPSNGEGDALMIRDLVNGHNFDLPIEHINLKRQSNGDTVVLGSRYNVYDAGSNLKSIYRLETENPLSFRTQFIPSYYYYNYPTLPSYNIVKDSKYKLQETAQYTTSNLLKDISTKKGTQAILWDELNNTVIANCTNAISDDIAYSSFETAAKGNWSYTGTGSPETGCPTGSNSYALTNGNISKSGLNPSKTYFVTYWSKNGPQSVNGTTAVAGRSFLQFTYYEHKVQNPAGGNISVSGSGTIDELRLYPENSFMTSYTYKPLIGISSQSDQGSGIRYYEYDMLDRLAIVRDMDNNVLKKICYNYAGQPENCITCTNFTPNWQNTTTALRCQQGSCGNTGYQEQEQRDMNTCSLSYDSTRWIPAGYNPTACPLSCVNLTSTNVTGAPGYTATYDNGTSVYTFSVPATTGLQPLGNIPAGNYTLTIVRTTGIPMYGTFKSGCWKQTITGTSATFYNVAVSTSTCNSITVDISGIE